MDINDKIVLKDKDFNTIPIEEITFSDGAKQLKIDPKQVDEVLIVSIDPQCPIDQIPIYLALLNTILIKPYGLHIPYFPYARADRIFDEGASFGLQAFINLIDWGMVTSLGVTDIHNIDNLQKLIPDTHIYNMNNGASIIEGVILNDDLTSVYIVSPDKGATDRANLMKDDLCLKTPVIQCSKTRDVTTGKITSFNIHFDNDLTGKICVIIDDICDAGGTFIPIAHKLKEKGAKRVYLYVSHGIFSKGLTPFEEYIDGVFCMYSIGNYAKIQDIVNFNNRRK